MIVRYFHCVLFMICVVAFTAEAVFARGEPRQRSEELRRLEKTWTGEDPDVEVATLISVTDHIRAGLRRNPEIKAAFYRWKASLRDVSRAFSLPDPEITFSEYIEDVETRVGPQERSYGVRQKIPFGDKLWVRRSSAFHKSEARYFRLIAVRREVIRGISDVYYELAYLDKAIGITRENMNLLGNFERVAQSKYSSGLKSNQDLLKIQLELGRLENELRSLEDMRTPVQARLAALLNLQEHAGFKPPDETLESLPDDEVISTEEMTALLKDNNPVLKIAASQTAGQEDDWRLAKRGYVPDVTLGLTRIETGEALVSSTPDSGKDPLLVSVSVNVPIWFSRVEAQIDGAEALWEESKAMERSSKQDLRSRLAMARYRLRDAARQSKMYRDALIPKAVQTMNATQSAYESGGMDFLSLIEAQRVLLNFQKAFYRHNADYYQRRAEVEELIGDGELF